MTDLICVRDGNLVVRPALGETDGKVAVSIYAPASASLTLRQPSQGTSATAIAATGVPQKLCASTTLCQKFMLIGGETNAAALYWGFNATLQPFPIPIGSTGWQWENPDGSSLDLSALYITGTLGDTYVIAYV
jgi:hypothetical protein